MRLKTFLFAGASSSIAKEAAFLLKSRGHAVIGISTKPVGHDYDQFYEVENYDFGAFPAIETAIDGIVYFPGTINLKPFARLKATEFMEDMQINALGGAAFVQAYLSNLKKAENGSVVFISSVAVSTGLPFHASISMAKGALEGLTKALAAELAPGIRVNCVAPSLVDSPLGNRFINTPEKLEAMQKRNPMHKVGTPVEVANAIVFLLLEESSWVTGQVLAVDGGMNSIKNS